LARDLGVVVLYPEQAQRANAQKCWNWFKPQHQQRGRGEPAFLAALAQSMAAQHGVDSQRIYVAGLSAGGAMADIMGRCYPDVFAAVGVHSGLPTGAATDVVSALSAMRSGAQLHAASSAGHIPPTIVFHGDADSTVHIHNAEAIVKAARAASPSTVDGVAPTQTHTGRSEAGQHYTRHVDRDGTGKSRTEYWQLHGAGHAWSGGSRKGSYTNAGGVDASAEMLRFFLTHSLRTH
jgi:poly(hydroxyalkanoate) depolymerase family esterase